MYELVANRNTEGENVLSNHIGEIRIFLANCRAGTGLVGIRVGVCMALQRVPGRPRINNSVSLKRSWEDRESSVAPSGAKSGEFWL